MKKYTMKSKKVSDDAWVFLFERKNKWYMTVSFFENSSDSDVALYNQKTFEYHTETEGLLAFESIQTSKDGFCKVSYIEK